MTKLKPEELTYIKRQEKDIRFFLKRLEQVRCFQLGDYLVGFSQTVPIYSTKEFYPDEPLLNSYGLPTKYIVAVVDKNGIPYLKELNKKGIPFGRLITIIQLNEGNEFETVYKIDPDYEDYLILGNSEPFDPTKIQNARSSIHKDITKHNRQHKIDTYTPLGIQTFLNTLSVGSTVWRSYNTSWTITKIIKRNLPIKVAIFKTLFATQLLEVQNSKGLIFEVSLGDLYYKALYHVRPRTYKELNNI